MPTRYLHNLLGHLRRVSLSGATGAAPDGLLLERFLVARDESAFELLVWRHAPMVFGVCRRLLIGEQDAEDAFQATFLTLACKAGTVQKQASVAAWLYRVAYRLALRARAGAAERTRHERQAVSRLMMPIESDGASEAVRLELREVLDQEIHRLPPKYRAPIILCYLEGKTNQEAADQLECPTGTIVTRLARARRKLRARLTRRGLAISSAAFATVLASTARPSLVQSALIEAAVRTGTVTSIHEAAATGLVSARVAALSKGVSNAMVVTKIKTLAAVLLVLGLAVAGPTALSFRTSASESPVTRPDEPGVPGADQPPPEAKKKVAADSGKRSQKAEEKVTKTFTTGTAPHVTVSLHNGGIRLEASSDRQVNIEVTKEARAETQEAAKEALKKLDVKLAQEGDKIAVTVSDDVAKSNEISLSASAVLKVPAGAVLELNTKNGGVTVIGGSGILNVQTNNGSIHVTDRHAPQQLKTINGAIVVKGGTGKLDLETNNGGIDIQADKAVVTATTRNGAVTFAGSLAEGKQSLQTTNGAVRLTLPADARFRIDAHTTLGSISNDFKVDSPSGKTKTHLAGSVGKDPATSILLKTTNGTIEIHAKK